LRRFFICAAGQNNKQNYRLFFPDAKYFEFSEELIEEMVGKMVKSELVPMVGTSLSKSIAIRLLCPQKCWGSPEINKDVPLFEEWISKALDHFFFLVTVGILTAVIIYLCYKWTQSHVLTPLTSHQKQDMWN